MANLTLKNSNGGETSVSATNFLGKTLSNTSTLYLNSGANTSIIFTQGDSEIARLNTSGCLSIGSSAYTEDAYKLYCGGNAYLDGSLWCNSYIYANNGQYRTMISFIPQVNNQVMGFIRYSNGANTSTVLNDSRFIFFQYSYTSDSNSRLNYYDYFYLPNTSADKSANNGYQILTTKDWSALDNRYVNISGDTMTGSLTVSSDSTTYMNVTTVNSNGSVSLASRGNRGLFDNTRGIWLIYTDNSSGNTKIQSDLYPSSHGTLNLGAYTSCYNQVVANGLYISDDDASVNVGYGNLRVVTAGTTSTQGVTQLNLGNSTANGNAGNAYGRIYFGSTGAYGNYLYPVDGDVVTANQYFYFPNKGGILVTHPTRGTAVGSATKPVYINASGVATACTYANTVVTQSRSASSNWRPILTHYTYAAQGTDPDTATNGVYYNEKASIQPSTGSIYSAGTITCRRIIATATKDAQVDSANSVALITGSATGQHLEFDNNEIISKASDTTGGVLYLNSNGIYTQLYTFAGYSGLSYGSTLPTAVAVGQIFFKT